MFYVRSPTEGGQEAVIEALSVIWQVCFYMIYDGVEFMNFKNKKVMNSIMHMMPQDFLHFLYGSVPLYSPVYTYS